MSTLKDKHVWIVGASSGIGAALAEELSHRGARITASARSEDKLRSMVANLSGPASATPCDVTDYTSIFSALPHPAPDVVVYCAGAYLPMIAEKMDIAGVENIINVNLRGAFRLLDAILPPMIERHSGQIVLVGSVAGYFGLPQSLAYGATKAGIRHLAETLAIELKDQGIQVQLVSPGFVKTPLTAKNEFPMPFIMEPEDAARCIADGMESKRFEIHFPRRLSLLMKAVALLPYAIRIPLLRKAVWGEAE